MKRIVNGYYFLLLIAFACSDHGINNECADPIGSDELSLNDASLICFKESFNGCFEIDFDSPTIEINAINLGGELAVIIDIGSVGCLGDVNSKPSTGFGSTVTAIVNHGYIIKFPDDTYGRFYIDSYEGSPATALNVTRQYTF